jgi:hypothetical protein
MLEINFTFTNMETVRNFKVIYGKFHVIRIYISGNQDKKLITKFYNY